jgi:hypothetical protein
MECLLPATQAGLEATVELELFYCSGSLAGLGAVGATATWAPPAILEAGAGPASELRAAAGLADPGEGRVVSPEPAVTAALAVFCTGLGRAVNPVLVRAAPVARAETAPPAATREQGRSFPVEEEVAAAEAVPLVPAEVAVVVAPAVLVVAAMSFLVAPVARYSSSAALVAMVAMALPEEWAGPAALANMVAVAAVQSLWKRAAA